MKKCTFIISSILFLSLSSFGQTALELLRLLPGEQVPWLTETSLDSLTAQGTYILPGGDSIETTQYHYSSEGEDHLNLHFSYTTGQRGFFNIELRTFQKTNGNLILIYAKHGGSYAAFDQHILRVFDVNEGRLITNNNTGLPEFIKSTAFLKPEAPDEVKRNIMSTGYDLYPDIPNSIEYSAFSPAISWDKWFAIKDIVFTWNGNRFVRKQTNK